MSTEVDELTLRAATSPEWLPAALRDFDQVLIDHAHCEKKAAAHALSLINLYAHVPGVARAMARLAAEDLGTINALLERTLERRTVIACVRGYFREREARRRQEEDSGHAS